MSKIKEVLFVMHSYGGGAEKVCADLANELAKKNYAISVFCIKNIPELPSLFKANVDFRMPRTNKAIDRALFILGLAKSCKNIDILVGSLELQSIFLTALLRRGRAIGWLHKDLEAFFKDKGRVFTFIYSNLMRWSAGRLEKIICVSAGVKESVSRIIPRESAKFYFLPNPIDQNTILERAEEPLPVKLTEIYKKPVILSVGRLAKQKDYGNFLEAFSEAKKVGIPHNLCILGEGGERNFIEAHAKKLGISEFCFFPGFMDPYRAMKEADLFVLSSVFEGLSLVIVEAMILGKPIVSTDCPSGPAYLLKDGEVGILVPVKNPKALGEAMVKMQKSETKKHYSAKSLERSVDFSFDEAIQDWINILS